ncbi:PREDICTED: interferon regulatory factor 4-like [Thamnophis sirtalis]|uniref:Interferon regulatory factor 4-like n=1 Tax=Thamnophis sirtalis TaxID=35019 RepID=A0A6I9Y9L0_9SAUR|nr:PREDICTED: interferon regulatory factor 4-like [Thamnophis sirtalis]
MREQPLQDPDVFGRPTPVARDIRRRELDFFQAAGTVKRIVIRLEGDPATFCCACGRYPGLRWEDRQKTVFRIPWKHAAKQDYREPKDAALFKAWAVYKGKYREGLDEADPSVWKTRLRCALNKSPDFKEVPEKSRLEALEPYKVYQVVSPEAAQDAEMESGTDSPLQLKCPLAPGFEAAAAHGLSEKVSLWVGSLQIL